MSRLPYPPESPRYTWKRLFAPLLAAAVMLPVYAVVDGPAEAQESDSAVEVIDSWNVTGPETFPDIDGVLPAFRPAMTQAPNGDLLVAFNTTTDARPGGEIRLIRSTDDGRTWGPSEVIASESRFGDQGSMHLQRGMATLRDGTILLPYNDAVNHAEFNNRESHLYVARSTDNGHTWTGTDEPVEMPIPIREQWQGGGRILELTDGTLLQPIWGALELVDGWQTDPMRWRAGVLRSFDGGETWEDYQEVAYDPHNPPTNDGRYPNGANESALTQLPDGRIAMAIRYGGSVGTGGNRFLMSYSDDNGSTWTPPVQTDKPAQTVSLTNAPCTDQLAGDAGKLLLGHRHLSGIGSGAAAIVASYDEGTTWQDEVFLEEPGGAELGTFSAAEPEFHRLDERRMLVVFQVQTEGPYRLVANVIEDADANECREAADAAQQRAETEPTVFLEREDRDNWPLPLALAQESYPSDTLVSEIAADAAEKVMCGDHRLQLWRREADASGRARPLNPRLTLAEAGVGNGDVLQVRSIEEPSKQFRVGHAELDVSPDTRHVYAWNDACDYPLEFDFRSRSLGIDVRIPPGQELDSIELRDADSSSRLDTDDDLLPSIGGFVNNDTDPANGSLGEFGFAAGVAIDYQRRSVGVDLSAQRVINRIELMARDDTSRLDADDYTLWASKDNINYEQVHDWTWSAEVVDGHLVHTFDEFEVAARYVKINTRYDDTAYTFALDSLTDFRVFGECTDDDCPPHPQYRLFVSDDNEHYTELDGWTFQSRLDDGRLVHRFADLDVTSRYVKISQPFRDQNVTFVLESLRDDVSLELTQQTE